MRTRKSKNSKSQYFGVIYHSQLNKWQARIKKDHKSYYLGVYVEEKDAAIAYNKKATELYGEKANLNIII
jgi:IMP cyclohydrolase